MKKYTGIALVLLLSACGLGCAKAPGSIEAAPVAPNRYAHLTCEQAMTELGIKSYDLIPLSREQEEAARADAWNVLVFGVPLSGIEGKRKTEEIARLKGEIDALNARVARCER